MKVWFPLAALYALFLYWYGGTGAPLSEAEIRAFTERIERTAPNPEAADRLLEFARTDDGREFYMVNLNRYRAEPRYADGRDAGDASAEEVDSRYAREMIPRLLARACHPWVIVEPIQTLADHPGVPRFDRVTLVRYRSRRDFLEVVVSDTWRVDAEHKWAALEVAHSFPARPVISLLGPRAALLGALFAVGVALRAAGRRRGRGET